MTSRVKCGDPANFDIEGKFCNFRLVQYAINSVSEARAEADELARTFEADSEHFRRRESTKNGAKAANANSSRPLGRAA